MLEVRNTVGVDGKVNIPHDAKSENFFSSSGEHHLAFLHWSPHFHWHENNSNLYLDCHDAELRLNDLESAAYRQTLLIDRKTNDLSSKDLHLDRGQNLIHNFFQRIRLPRYIRIQKGEAKYESGKLTIAFPK